MHSHIETLTTHNDNTQTHTNTHTHTHTRQAYVERPKAKPEFVRRRPHGKYFEMLLVRGEQDRTGKQPQKEGDGSRSVGDVSQHAVNLENFEEHEGQRIASPTSVAIMNMYGVLQQVKCLRAYHLVHDVCVCVCARECVPVHTTAARCSHYANAAGLPKP